MSEHPLLTPRYERADASLPGRDDFWVAMLDESDNFAFKAARDGHGGPFGAQLWLVYPDIDRYVVVGMADRLQDANAVLSKGVASAHAESENLSPANRRRAIDFLEARRDENWHVVQVSSSESCQSCRAKQILFANELIARGLIERGQFHVVFKASYGQAKRDADFNDAPYDMTFRALAHLGVLDHDGGLFDLENALRSDPTISALIETGDLIYNAVTSATQADLPSDVRAVFERADDQPLAVVASPEGHEILATGADHRDPAHDVVHRHDMTALLSALHRASERKRQAGVFESWDLKGATLFTNVRDLGPLAYAETLWCNLSNITVVRDAASEAVDLAAREDPMQSNCDLYKAVAAEYNSSETPVRTRFLGDPNDANAAHRYWAAHVAREAMLDRQAERLRELGDMDVGLVDGSSLPLEQFIETTRQHSHYDGKQPADRDSAE